MHNASMPVLIVGGGPVGLSTSLFLARHGVPSLLVERHEKTSIHPRARGINARTMELFRSLGLEESVRTAGAALARNHHFLAVETLAGAELWRTYPWSSRDYQAHLKQLSPMNWCMCAQDELEPLLVTAARTLNCELRFGSELMAFEQDNYGVTARIRERNTGEEYIANAHYLIAADGAGSPVRHMLNVSTRGRGTLGHYINIYFRANLSTLVQDREFILCLVKNPEAQGVLLSVNNTDRWIFMMLYVPESGRAVEDFTPERCIEFVRNAAGLPRLAIEIISIVPWEAAIRVAESFQRDRVFLVGDAAHVMPPTGAFGMNTGIQDAHNLAWKLAAVLNGQAGPALLATYDVERRPVAQFTAEQAGLRSDNHADYYSSGMVDDFAVALGYRYQSAAVISEKKETSSNGALDLSGQPGTRAPHIWVGHQGRRISTLDLFDTRFVLLAGMDGNAWCHAAREGATALGLPLDAYCVGATGDLIDLDGNWGTTYGVTPSGVVLVRPDGFVGWRTERIERDAKHTLEMVLKHLLCHEVDISESH